MTEGSFSMERVGLTSKMNEEEELWITPDDLVLEAQRDGHLDTECSNLSQDLSLPHLMLGVNRFFG